MSAAFFGAFQPTHLQITRGGWRLPSRTSHSPLSSPLASKNRRCSMQLVTLDAQFEAETGAKLARVHVMLRNRIPQRPGDAHDRRPSSIALASPITRSTLDVARQLALRSGSILRLTVESRWCLLMALSGLSCGSDKRRLLTLNRHGYAQSPIHAATRLEANRASLFNHFEWCSSGRGGAAFRWCTGGLSPGRRTV